MAGAAGGSMLLAGCSGDGGGGDGGSTDDTAGDGSADTTTGGGEPVVDSFVEPITVNPTNYQYNHLNLTTPFSHAMQSDQLQRYFIDSEEFESYAVSVEEFGEGSAVLKVRDGLTWHNGDPGDPVDADDLYTKLVTDDIVSDSLSTLWTDIERTGDRSVELTLDGNVNRDLFRDALNYYWLETPYRMYRDYVERWEDASSEDTLASLREELRNDAFEEPKGNGPFQFEEVTANRLRMSKYEHHPDADNINWEYWDLERVSTNTSSVLLGMEVDGIRNYTAPESVRNDRPDALQVAFLPAQWGHSLPFNMDDPDFGNIRVRQAIAEFIDREACATNYGTFAAPVEAPSGLVGNIDGQNEPTDRWTNKVSDEMAQQLHRYRDPERGRRLLREEGYTKEDGQWLRPDGSRLSMPIKVPAGYTDWHPVYQTIVSNLKEEGIQSRMVTIEATAYWSNHYLAGNFQAASTGWTLQRTSPYYVFDMYYNIDASFMNFEPSTLEVPPVGEPDGELQSVDVESLMSDLLVSSGEENTDLTDQLAWITNQSIPMLPIQEINDQVWFTTDDWNVPAPDDPRYQSKWPLWWFPRNGNLTAKTA
ncbi:ABC transporter periplasmic subunit [Candidatus Halobonum tyrrellensis G22]|uniref:ABC transporter periplasmic subunit n=2 Tax=Candidatus Halobonum TaxID=1431544 RepID=V4HHZ1_9EURY|nr:ABC transporter periplasmic subunit [Candidatus Halobonum tyrrellensis G22]